MKTLLKILCLFKVLTGVLTRSGNVYEVTEGDTVEIRCLYPDDHKHTPKYLCRYPCTSSQYVLIKSSEVDQVDSAGRYSLINIVSGRFFTVTIKHLRLKDSGVYYCGLDQWFRDKLEKVILSVRPVAPVSRSTHTPENTHIPSTWTPTLTSAVSDNSHSDELLSSTVQSAASTPPVNSSSAFVTVVCAGIFFFLVFWILVGLMCIYSTRSDAKSRYLKSHTTEDTAQDPPDYNQAVDNVCTMVEYSLDDPPKEDCSSLKYSTILLHVTQ